MVRKLTILYFIFFIGCEINSEQLIKSERVNFENVKFNAVSKNLNFKNPQSGIDVNYTKNDPPPSSSYPILWISMNENKVFVVPCQGICNDN